VWQHWVLAASYRVSTCDVRSASIFRFLASGSDDTLILLWRAKADPTSESPASTFIWLASLLWSVSQHYPHSIMDKSLDARSSVIWSVVYSLRQAVGVDWNCRLRGHEMDVLDLAWSTNDDYLASCSIDNKVLVWSTRSITVMMTPMRALLGHSNWVKVRVLSSLHSIVRGRVLHGTQPADSWQVLPRTGWYTYVSWNADKRASLPVGEHLAFPGLGLRGRNFSTVRSSVTFLLLSADNSCEGTVQVQRRVSTDTLSAVGSMTSSQNCTQAVMESGWLITGTAKCE